MSAENDSGDNNQHEEKPFLKVIVHSFFIIPFLIAVFCVLLFAGIYLLTSEKRSVYDYLEDIKIGGLNKRWQGAFELSKILANPKHVPKEERFINEMVSAFEQAQHDDPRVRQYLALAMGRTQDERFTQPLVKCLKEEKENNLTAIVYALGMLKQKETADGLYPLLGHPNARIRSVAVVALGNIANPESIPLIKNALGDLEENVQWGAAISLAHMGNNSGKEIIAQLLSRQYLSQFVEVDANEQNHLILTAIEAARLLKEETMLAQLQELSANDQNMKIRSAALNVLENQ
ncbi:MAG TPA: HEAT repeat domain-containing protein [Candidatus Omnitrophota bacterium]|nr:HEAT repeat domain-containing protein [Candidatus Omnitrophota bacterium]